MSGRLNEAVLKNVIIIAIHILVDKPTLWFIFIIVLLYSFDGFVINSFS